MGMTIQELRNAIFVAKKMNAPKNASVLTMILDVAQKIAKADGDRNVTHIDIEGAAKRLHKQGMQSKEAGMDVDNELKVLETFLPKRMSEDETRVAVEESISKGASNLGMVMNKLKQDYNGVDMKVASQIAKELLPVTQ